MHRFFLCFCLAVVSAPVSLGEFALTSSPYTQNFNSLGSGLPSGWTVRTGATASSLGTSQTFNTAAVSWATGTGQFLNAASATGRTGSEVAETQSASTDRALAVRQTAGFGDPGAAFVFQIQNTSGLSNFNLQFDAMTLSVQGRTTTWTVDYGTGASPSTFTPVGATFQDLVSFGTANRSFSFGSSLDDIASNVWIRIVTLSDTAGSGSRDTFGIDNFQLTFTAIPEPSSLLGGIGIGGLGLCCMRKRRRTAI